MTLDFPAPFNQHNGDPNADTRFSAQLGSPQSLNQKANGGIPLSETGQQWQENTAGTTSGIQWDFEPCTCNVNLTCPHEIFMWAWQVNAPNRVCIEPVACCGNRVRMYSSTGVTCYRTWQIAGQDTFGGKFRQGPMANIIDPLAPGTCADSGTYDPTSLNAYSMETTRASPTMGGAGQWTYVTDAVRLGTTKSATNIPRLHGMCVCGEDFFNCVNGCSWCDTTHVNIKQLGDTFFLAMPMVIGKCAVTTTFNDNGKTYLSPAHACPSDPQIHITNKAMRFYIDSQGMCCTFTFSGTWCWGTQADWDFDSNVCSTITLTSPTFKGMGLFTIGGDVCGSATFNGVNAVQVLDIDACIDGSTIRCSTATPIGFAFQDDGGVFTDDTTDAKDTGTNDVQMFTNSAANNDAFYFGKDKEFDQLEIDVGTASSGGTLVWEYFNSTTDGWSDLSETDNTMCLQNTGVNTVTWTLPINWEKNTVNSQEAFWVRARKTGGTMTTGPIADTITTGDDQAGALVLDYCNMCGSTINCITFNCNDRALEVTDCGTYTLNNISFNCNTINVRNSSGGAVTLTLQGTTTLMCCEVESIGAGSITISQSQTVTINVSDLCINAVEGARVGVFTTPVSACDCPVICGTTNMCGVVTDTTSFTSCTAVQVRVRLKGFLPFATNATISPTNGLTVCATLLNDNIVNLP